MDTVEIWLQKIGLGQFAQLFADNAVDEEVLLELTDDDLKGLGLVLGHRKKILKAIATLKGELVPVASSAGPVSVAAPTSGRSIVGEAERRQLTVVFCDIVGSTSLSSQLDAEDLRPVIRAYQEACAEIVSAYDGYIAQYLGDGIMVYFGYPRAHEDSAERAVRAALGMIEAVQKLTLAVPLQVRVGMATGAAVVGDLIGAGTAAAQHAVTGQTPNLAARVQSLADPGALTISASTYRLVGHLFECAELGSFELKGIPGRVPVWKVVGERAIKSRFDAAHLHALTRFVGRDQELGRISELWARSEGGSGQVALLIGEPGIGKSRLIQALRQSLAAEEHTDIHFQCSAHHTNSPFHPILLQLEDAASLSQHDSAEERLSRLQACLARAGLTSDIDVQLFASLLSIPTPRYPPLSLTPAKQKERIIEGLGRYVRGTAARLPTVLFFEDLHWIDPSSMEALTEMVAVARESRVLVVISQRPEVTPSWSGAAHVTAIHLQRLEPESASAIIASLLGGKPVPEEVKAQIIQKSEGIPLFVEELTKTVLESGILREEGDRFVLIGQLTHVAIPETLQGSLMARLDRLSAVKQVAQVGAALGRQFSHALLAAVAGVDPWALQDALDRMGESGLIFVVGTPPDATYFFKHALIQEAAYEMMLRGTRQLLHRGIADVLKSQFPEMVLANPEVMAHHLMLAGSVSEAIGYLENAGTRALATFANVEAIALLTRALDSLMKLPDEPERTRRQLGLLVLLGRAMIASRGYAAAETRDTLLRAKALFDDTTPPGWKFAVLYGLCACYYVGGEVPRMEEAAFTFLEFADQLQDSGARCLGHRLVGSTHFAKGDLREALDWLDRGEKLYDPEKHPAMVHQYGQDIGVTILCYQAMAHWLLGRVEESARRQAAALKRARELNHPLTLGYTLGHLLSMLGVCRRAADEIVGPGRETMTYCAELGLKFWEVSGIIAVGWAEVKTGHAAQGMAKIQAGIQGWIKSGARTWLPTWQSLEAECLLEAGNTGEAKELVDRALSQAAQNGESWCVAEIHRIKGRVELAAGDAAGAERSLLESLEIARSQNALSWELRTATDLARHWGERGRKAEAAALLRGIRDRFTEGWDSPDMQAATETLATLEGST